MPGCCLLLSGRLKKTAQTGVCLGPRAAPQPWVTWSCSSPHHMSALHGHPSLARTESRCASDFIRLHHGSANNRRTVREPTFYSSSGSQWKLRSAGDLTPQQEPNSWPRDQVDLGSIHLVWRTHHATSTPLIKQRAPAVPVLFPLGAHTCFSWKENIKRTNQKLTDAICVSSFVSLCSRLQLSGSSSRSTGSVSCALLTQAVMKSLQWLIMRLTLVIWAQESRKCN